MMKTNGTRENANPVGSQEAAAIVIRELQHIIVSPHFCNSKNYPAFLQYIVEKTLAGEADQLKERTLGIEVFDRPPSFDTNNDSVVRFTAGEVRKRLMLYYSEQGLSSPVQLMLPVGSYAPEFHFRDQGSTDAEASSKLASSRARPEHDSVHAADHGEDSINLAARARLLPLGQDSATAGMAEGSAAPARLASTTVKIVLRRFLWPALACLLLVLVFLGYRWRERAVDSQLVLNDFWSPVLSNQHSVLICTGGVVMAQKGFSGVHTANKDSDYPFVSIQIATAISRLSSLLEHSGVTAHLQSASTTPLTDLREHPVILLGGYNNQWTIRLLQPLRFHFADEPDESIVDQSQQGVALKRDHSLTYANQDDYALVARFRDPTTNSWVVALAGLGRNGSEAASDFVSSPQYLLLLQNQLGKKLSNQNFEVVLKVKVIDGKTGAPSIMKVFVW